MSAADFDECHGQAAAQRVVPAFHRRAPREACRRCRRLSPGTLEQSMPRHGVAECWPAAHLGRREAARGIDVDMRRCCCTASRARCAPRCPSCWSKCACRRSSWAACWPRSRSCWATASPASSPRPSPSSATRSVRLGPDAPAVAAASVLLRACGRTCGGFVPKGCCRASRRAPQRDATRELHSTAEAFLCGVPLLHSTREPLGWVHSANGVEDAREPQLVSRASACRSSLGSYDHWRCLHCSSSSPAGLVPKGSSPVQEPLYCWCRPS